MAKEIERKFLVKKLPEYVKNCKKLEITQWYISSAKDSVTNRLRLYGDGKAIFEIKTKGSIVREEVGFPVNFEDFKDLIKDRPFIEKDRYIVEKTDKLEIVVDVYKGSLTGLMVLEVEGGKLNDVVNWLPYNWVGEEVTGNDKYSNSKLAETYTK